MSPASEIREASHAFQLEFCRAPDRVFRAPGRIELLGNHTDYNQGLVLGMTLDLGITVAVAHRSDRTIRLRSSAFPDSPANLDSSSLRKLPRQHWARYLLALVPELKQEGFRIGGFDGVVTSSLPSGGGLSSSAALLVATVIALTGLPHRTGSERLRIARICERAEHRLGVNCGLLDYLTILHGKAGRAVFMDLRSLRVEVMPWPKSLTLVLVDSGVRHELSDGRYNRIVRTCAAAASACGVRSLRELHRRDLETAVPGSKSKSKLSPRQREVALHVLEENERVRRATRSLKRKAYSELGPLFTASHASSRDQLRNSCPALDDSIQRASTLPGWLGGRLTGGGFGGMTLHLVKARSVGEFFRALPNGGEQSPKSKASVPIRVGPWNPCPFVSSTARLAEPREGGTPCNERAQTLERK